MTMNSTWIVMASVPLLFAPAASVMNGGSGARSEQKLVRVQPNADEDEAFDREGWRKKLTQSDLDGRERAYERVVELARRKDTARQALESWASDANQPDLAWTARLALRSLNAPGGVGGVDDLSGTPQWNDLHSRMDQLRRRFDSMDPMFDNMQRDLERLFEQPPTQSWTPQSGPSGGSSQAQSFRLQMGPDGVTCEVTENVDGDQKTSTYKAGSVEELLQTHPELRDRIGVGGGDAHAWSRNAPQGGLFQALPPRSHDGSRRALGAEPPTNILGINYSKPAPEKLKDLDLDPEVGLQVDRTESGTIADILGIQRGDIVIELNGTALHDASDVTRVLKKRDANGELAVVIVDRKGQRRTLTWKPSTQD
jgi:hypothetical protein